MDPIKVVEAFGAAWADHDLDAALAMVSGDCVFDATGPATRRHPMRRRRCHPGGMGCDLRRPQLPLRGGGDLPGRRPSRATVAVQLRRRARARR